MNKFSDSDKFSSSENTDQEIERDLKVYRRATDQNQPQLSAFVRRAQAESKPSRLSLPRPRLAVAGAFSVVLLALLLLPISYEQTVGHELSIQVQPAEANHQGNLDNVLADLRARFGEARVQFRTDCEDWEQKCELMAFVPAEGELDPSEVLRTCVDRLLGEGFDAHTGISPKTTRVSGNMARLAKERVFFDGTRSRGEWRQSLSSFPEAAGGEGQVFVLRDDPQSLHMLFVKRREAGGDRQGSQDVRFESRVRVREEVLSEHMDHVVRWVESELAEEGELPTRLSEIFETDSLDVRFFRSKDHMVVFSPETPKVAPRVIHKKKRHDPL